MYTMGLERHRPSGLFYAIQERVPSGALVFVHGPVSPELARSDAELEALADWAEATGFADGNGAVGWYASHRAEFVPWVRNPVRKVRGA